VAKRLASHLDATFSNFLTVYCILFGNEITSVTDSHCFIVELTHITIMETINTGPDVCEVRFGFGLVKSAAFRSDWEHILEVSFVILK
jgi:hypothetical protein